MINELWLMNFNVNKTAYFVYGLYSNIIRR